MNRAPAGEFEAVVDEWAQKLAGKSPVLMRLGKDAMCRQLDMPWRTPSTSALAARSPSRRRTSRRASRRSSRSASRAGRGAEAMAVSLVAMRCRTADRFPGALQGVEILAPLVGEALVWSRATSAAPARCARRASRRTSRDARLPARGRRSDRRCPACRGRSTAARADCAVSLTTLPAVVRHRPEARCSGSMRTATTTPRAPPAAAISAACACGRLRRVGRRPRRDDPTRAGGAGGRPRPRFGRARAARGSAATVIGASTVETLVAVKNAPDDGSRSCAPGPRRDRSGALPGGSARAGGPAPGQALRPARPVVEDCELVGLEVTAFEAPEAEQERLAATETAMHVPSRCSTTSLIDDHPRGRRRLRHGRRFGRSWTTCTSGARSRGPAAARSGSRASTSRRS